MGGRGYLSKNPPKLFSHFKLQCSDLWAIARTNSALGKESCALAQDPEIQHSATLHAEVWNAALTTRCKSWQLITTDVLAPSNSWLVHELAKTSLCEENSSFSSTSSVLYVWHLRHTLPRFHGDLLSFGIRRSRWATTGTGRILQHDGGSQQFRKHCLVALHWAAKAQWKMH